MQVEIVILHAILYRILFALYLLALINDGLTANVHIHYFSLVFNLRGKPWLNIKSVSLAGHGLIGLIFQFCFANDIVLKKIMMMNMYGSRGLTC